MEDDASTKTVELQRLALLDHEDAKAIMALEKRIEARQIERDALQSQEDAGDVALIKDEPPVFESLLKAFQKRYSYPDAARDALVCPGCCGRNDLDDPILTDCLHLYCMECFTHMLYDCQSDAGIDFIECLDSAEDQIRDCVVLDRYQWNAIKAAAFGEEQMAETAVACPSKSMTETPKEEVFPPVNEVLDPQNYFRRRPCALGSSADDVERLWHSLDWRKDSFHTSRSATDAQDIQMGEEGDSDYTTDCTYDSFGTRSEEYEENSFIDDGTEQEPETENESVMQADSVHEGYEEGGITSVFP